jgi:hypothetical protein
MGVALGAACLSNLSAAATFCPSNRIVLSLSGTTIVDATSTEAVLDTSGSYTRGSYDLVRGVLGSNVDFYDPGLPLPALAVSSVDAEDDYWVLGLPPGVPVDFTAEFSVTGTWSVYPGVPEGNFTAGAFVAVGADTARFFIPGGCCHGTISQVISLPLHRAAYEPFRLHLHLASQDHRGRVSETGQLQFLGLPAGATVTNCHTTPVTPARATSWGQLKIRYR